MNYFHQIEGAQAILRSRGVFKQVDLYVYGIRVFAKWGSGFIGLQKYQQGTTKPDVSWVEILNTNTNIRISFDANGAAVAGEKE